MSDPVAVAAAPVAGNPAAEPVTTTPPAAVTQPTQEQPAATPPAPAPEVIGEPTPAVAADEGYAWQETGDPGLDVALTFIGGLGLGPSDPAVEAAIEGDFLLLEAKLEAMGDKSKGYQRFIALAKDAYTRTSTETANKQAAVTTAVNEVAGSPEAWSAIKKWAGDNAEPDEKEAINAMLTAGPLQARAAALMLSNLYNEAAGTTVNAADPVRANAGNSTPTNTGALSPSEYQAEVQALRAAKGYQMDGSPEYAALQARRLRWRG